MRTHALVCHAFVAVSVLLPTTGLALTLDSYKASLPVSSCLPASGQRVIFTGQFCDGAMCPPASLVTCGTHDVVQTGVPGVLGGRRQTQLFNSFEATDARIDDVAHRAVVRFNGTTESGFEIDYGTPFTNDPQDPDALNLDFVGLGVTSVQLAIDGNISASRPLLLVIELLTDAVSDPRPSANVIRIVDRPGVVSIPLSDFVPSLGFTMDQVDDIQIGLSNCLDHENGCPPETLFEALAFSLTPLELVTPPTAARPVSWGALKAIYR